ncbi:MAG TPA: branched-chain amino acid ABC transporter substrate-binding protein [Porticoccaceae bacterium]|nr:branched-chain amino acid ABC transporter substrate-binding protein [Porticoccaceae bacterium]
MDKETNFFNRLRQKYVFRIGAMYVVGSWLLLQFGEIIIEIMELPLWFGRALIAILALGFPFVVLLAWVFDATNRIEASDNQGNSQNQLKNAGKKIDAAIILVLALALGMTFLYYDRSAQEPGVQRMEPNASVQQSIATDSDLAVDDSDYLLIGNLVDFTGATGRSGQAWGQAIIDTANWINENGGVAGKLFDLDTIETSYLVRRALPAYKKWLTQDVLAIQGFGTNIGLALRDKVAGDRIPYFSSAMAASFTAPDGSAGVASPAPYSFFYGPSYSDACRGLVEWAINDWQSKNMLGAPSYVHMGDTHPYPDSPKAACEEYAEELGFEVAAPIVFSLIPEDYSRQCEILKDRRINYAFLANLDKSVTALLKQCSNASVSTRFMVNVWGFDEDVMRQAGTAADGVVWVMGASHWNASGPGMYTVRQVSMMSDPEQSKYRTVHYIRGVCSMFYLKEAIEIAAQQGQITGPSIKAAMYAKENWVPLGLEGVCRPATWQADDHRGVNEVLIYQAEVTDFPAQTSLERLFVDKRMSMQQVFSANIPRRPEWLGF